MPSSEVSGDLPPGRASGTTSWRRTLAWLTWVLGLVAALTWGIFAVRHTSVAVRLLAPRATAAGLASLTVQLSPRGPTPMASSPSVAPEASASSTPAPNAGPELANPSEPQDVALSVSGIEVEVLSEHRPGLFLSAARGVTNDEGKLQLTELPSGPAWLLVRSPFTARLARRLVLVGDQTVELDVAAARTLLVTVEDEAGAPVPSATVLLRPSNPTAESRLALGARDADELEPRSELPYGQVTDVHGAARLTNLDAGSFSLSVFAKGYSMATRENVDRDTKVTLTQLGSLAVSVLGPTGDPVSNAEVQLVGTRVWPAKRAATDEQGRVILGGLPEGLYDVRALRGSLVSPIVANVKLERGERRQLEVRLVEGRMVPITVTTSEEDAQPIPRAKLVLAEHGLSAFPLSAVADERGQATLGPLPPGPAFLSVRADGYIARGAVAVPEAGPMTVRLLRGGSVYGEIKDVDGRPIRDARIEVVGVDLDGLPIAESPLSAAYREAHFEFSLQPPTWVAAGELGVTFGPVPFVNMVTDAAAPTMDFTQLPADYSPWTSDADGHFRAHPVSPGRIRLIVRHNAFAEGQSRIFTMGPGGNVHVEVVLDVGHVLRGRVVDEGDRPVAGARVLVSGVHNGFERGISSSKDGTFEVRGVPGEVNVALARPTDTTRFVKRQKLTLQRGDSREVEFVLPEERRALTWTVYDDANRPVELAQVSVQSLDPDVPLRATRFTDAQGRVTIDDASGLDLRVAVEAPGYIPSSVQVQRATDDVTLTLSRGLKLSGRVTAVRGRTEVAGARVSLEMGARRDATTTTALGHYEFSNVPPGKVRLRVSHDDYAVAAREVVVTDTGHADRPFEVPDIDLNDAVTVRGMVVDGEGRPVPTARVATAALPEVRPKGAVDEDVVLTDDAGRFSLGGVAPGDVTLYAQSAIAGKGRIRVSVPPGGLEGVVIELTSTLRDEGTDFSPSVGSVALGMKRSDGAIVISSVPVSGEAERAGLMVGDVIVRIDGATPLAPAEARVLLSGPLSSDVVVTVVRHGQEQAYRVRREQTSR